MRRTPLIAITAYSLAWGAAAEAGELISGATILSVASASNNQEQFTITILGGTGPCAGQNITFPVSTSPSEMTWSTVFALAGSALKNGHTIKVYNYVNDDCSKATFLQVFK